VQNGTSGRAHQPATAYIESDVRTSEAIIQSRRYLKPGLGVSTPRKAGPLAPGVDALSGGVYAVADVTADHDDDHVPFQPSACSTA
jgi:hypothetical protein